MKVVEEGVYFLYDKDELVYIGQSDNLYRRIGQHIAERKKKFDRFELYPTTDRISRSDEQRMKVIYKGAKPIAWMPLPEPYRGEI